MSESDHAADGNQVAQVREELSIGSGARTARELESLDDDEHALAVHRSRDGAYCWWINHEAHPRVSVEPVESAVFAHARDKLPSRLESHLPFEGDREEPAPVVAVATVDPDAEEVVAVDGNLSAAVEYDEDGRPAKPTEVDE